MYRGPCHMVDCSDFIYDTYMCIHLPFNLIKYLAYMPNSVGIFVSGAYLARCEICIAIGFGLVHVCKNVGSLCPFSTLVL